MNNQEPKKEEEKNPITFMIIAFLKIFIFYFFMVSFGYKNGNVESIESFSTFIAYLFSQNTLMVLALSIATCIFCILTLIPASFITFIIEKYIKKVIETELPFYIAIIISCLFITYNWVIANVELYLCYLLFLPFEKIKVKGFIKRNKGVLVIWSIAAMIFVFLVMTFKHLDNDSLSEEYIENLKSISGKSGTPRIGGNNRGDDVSLLYERLIAKGYQVSDIGTEEVFRDKLSGKNNRIQLYNYIISRGDFKIGSYTDFDKRITRCYNQSEAYICTSKGSRTYHKKKDCKGLNRCSKQIKAVSVEQAKRMGRRECRICY